MTSSQLEATVAAIPLAGVAESPPRKGDSLGMMFRQLEALKVRWHMDCRGPHDCEIRTEDGTVGRGYKVGDALAELLENLAA
jgi:hypothetical protein